MTSTTFGGGAEEWVTIRIRMQDAVATAAAAKAIQREIRGIGGAADVTGMSMRRAGGHGFWFNQIMFTLRRTIYGVTLAFGGLAAGAALMGFKFDMGMEQARISFIRFLGSEQAAQKELDYLFDLAARGPFEFAQVTAAARQFMAFGFTLRETNDLLGATSDAVAGMGLGSDAIQRAVLALGQMRSSGRILGQDLRQLQELGLFSPDDFRKRLRLPQGYLGQVGELGIPSKVGIDAIVAYWKQRFGGASEDFQHTMLGELSTIKDYGAQTFGAMTQPLYDKLEKDINPLILQLAQNARNGFQQGGFTGFFRAIDEGVGHGINLEAIWTQLLRIGGALFIIFRNIGQSWVMLNRAGHPFLNILRLIAFTLGLVAWGMNALGPVGHALIALFIAERIATLLVAGALKTKAFWEGINLYWTKQGVKWTKIKWIWTNRMFIAEYAWAVASGVLSGALVMLQIAIFNATLATYAFTVALLANPLTWVILAVVALIAVLVLLYFKWDWFHNKIISIWNWIRTNWGMLGVVLIAPFLPLIAIMVLTADHFRTIIGLARRVGSAIKGAFGWVGKAGGFMGRHIPFFAEGGTMPFSGLALVGERGPELVHLPRGSSVYPNASIRGQVPVSGMSMGDVVIPLTVQLDSRTIAEEVTRVRLDRKARK